MIQESPIGPPERVSIVQCTGAEPQSSESSKEADHRSPVSVLEVLSIEDDVSSGPECFEQVSADLRGNYLAISLFKFFLLVMEFIEL